MRPSSTFYFFFFQIVLFIFFFPGCGVLTGIGSTQYATQVTPGSSVIVFGLGSVGLNIVQVFSSFFFLSKSVPPSFKLSFLLNPFLPFLPLLFTIQLFSKSLSCLK